MQPTLSDGWLYADMRPSLKEFPLLPDYEWNENSTIPSSLAQTLTPSMDDRKEIWGLLYGDEPMPSFADNAVEENFGILDREIKKGLTEAVLKRIFRRSRDI